MRLAITGSLAVALACTVTPAFGADCASDVNGDGIVDVQDLTGVVLAWGTDDASADINGDGIVDVQDLTAVIVDWGCESDGEDLTTLSGVVTNLWTGDPVEGVAVHVGDDTIMTEADGTYSGLFPVGEYEITFEATYFIEFIEFVTLEPDVPVFLDVELEPAGPVFVEITVLDPAAPGATVMAVAEAIVLDGSEVSGFEWTQLGGAEVIIDGANTDTVMIELAALGSYKAELFDHLREPPIAPEDLPPNVPPPPGEFPAGLQDRFQVVGVNPWAIEEAGLIVLDVAVTTTSGTYFGEEEVHTPLPWIPSSGLRNVPIETTVLLHAKDQAAYDWSLVIPGNSSAVLLDGDTQTPEFIPDVAGIYHATVTDEATGETVTIEIFCGNFRGVITGQDDDENPVSDATCVACHQNLGADKFTPWAETGHAEIFTQNFNSSGYWGPQCFACHTVGFDPNANNGGFDDAVDFEAFLASGLIGNPSPDNWATMLEQFPNAALLANAQCESCHGPQNGIAGVNTLAHGPVNPEGSPRVSLSSDVCATCHGEPLRHARFQQWQLSGHANYEVAIDEGDSGSCSRCHTANGFLAWLPILNGDVPGDPLDNIQVTWTPDEVHPQTCVTCHDPHMAGDSSGNDNNATVRISGDTPPLIAGFTATEVGRGAICMTCHNSRRGLRNDSTWPDYEGTSEAGRAPHGSAQTDMLMGENAYLVETGFRGAHSFLEDTCTTCHMSETPPPPDLAYNGGGTNHTFYASDQICSECHDGLDGPTIQAGVQSAMDILQLSIENALFDLMGEITAAGNTIDLDEEIQLTSVDDVADIEFTEYRGRQAVILTFTDDTEFGPYRMPDIVVLDGDLIEIGQLYDFADESLPKSGWNWALVHNDGSQGVHNPTFAYTTLSAAIFSLNPGMAATVDWPDWMPAQQLEAQPKLRRNRTN